MQLTWNSVLLTELHVLNLGDFTSQRNASQLSNEGRRRALIEAERREDACLEATDWMTPRQQVRSHLPFVDLYLVGIRKLHPLVLSRRSVEHPGSAASGELMRTRARRGGAERRIGARLLQVAPLVSCIRLFAGTSAAVLVKASLAILAP